MKAYLPTKSGTPQQLALAGGPPEDEEPPQQEADVLVDPALGDDGGRSSAAAVLLLLTKGCSSVSSNVWYSLSRILPTGGTRPWTYLFNSQRAVLAPQATKPASSSLSLSAWAGKWTSSSSAERISRCQIWTYLSHWPGKLSPWLKA